MPTVAWRLSYGLLYLIYRNALALLGAGYVLKRVLQETYILASGMRAYFMAPRGLARLNLRKYGQWAGIKQFTRDLMPLTTLNCQLQL